ncbi:(2E,6E)-farnesyl diphosphate synthase [Desulfosporosinus acididurans]|uniref:(2E,6E)-farnesyl diphosphate synthase n=1 Tax=Desulfosporosinus acididurans TaxID=476652 RepID=A0A0J1FSY6_9FIRM|nr:polyprenyl synthetase family protein [Desulfosporosinus acididurans]KLU66417.1 (2E,6E)-farnesyl diphosphate synthase [Desulfosporosinus acididurans]
MKLQLDQAITAGINKILTSAQLSSEMIAMINSSLNADSETGELFQWAHLTLMNCECVSGVFEDALPGAIAMELSALAIDIFDDIQDQDHDDLPWRQIPTAHALNLASCLSMLSYEAISMLPDDRDSRLYREIGQILSHMWITCSDGQLQDALFDTREQVTLDQYFELVKHKSGSLTACACKIGATLGGGSESLVLQLNQFGTYLGIMSQIRNDINDFLDFDKKKDFVNHKKTLPYVYLLNILKGKQAKQFKELTQLKGNVLERFGKEEQGNLQQLTLDEGAVHYGRVMYELFRQKSMEIIQAISVPEKRKEKMIKLVKENI